MDPAGLGAIIGISIMTGVFVGLKMCDIYKKRKRTRPLSRQDAKRCLSQAAQSKEEKRPILVMKRHWKMKDLRLPKSYMLYDLTIRKF
jgi:hypothetical protein